MIKNPGNGRIEVRQDYNSVVVEIPSKKQWTQTLFLMVWLVGWAVGEYFALSTLLAFDGPIFVNAFMIIWLIGWTFGGGSAFYTILWPLFGREIITVESGKLTIQRTVFRLRGKRKFETGSISEMKIIPDYVVGNSKREGKKTVGRIRGKIRFDYNKKIIRFGMGIEKQEAEMILDRLRQSGWLRSENFASHTNRSY